MPIPITIYDSSGKITRVVKVPLDSIEIQRSRAGENQLVGVDSIPETQYVSNGRVLFRPMNTSQKSGNTLINVPPGSIVNASDGSRVMRDGTTAVITSGVKTVRVLSPWPMQEATFDFIS